MVLVENNCMYSKDRSYASGLVSVKVQGNVGPAVDAAVKRDLVNMRTFHLEFDACSKREKLPACFPRLFGLEVAPFVMIRDPNQNEIEMAVEKKNGKVYLAGGWEILGRFYKMLEGAWMTVIYVSRHLFLFELRNMHGEELPYPRFSPPQRILLLDQNAHDYRNSVFCYGENAHSLPTKFSHLLVKELSEADVTGGRLKLGWLGFCQATLPVERTELTLVDYLGYPWKLVMDFCNDECVSCIFIGQWHALSAARKFTKGQIIKLGVTGEANNTVMYLCTPPMLVLKTTVQPSAATAGGVAYRVLEHFWRN